ncbi:MAG: T9SS C-terminal target domain-containing protein [Bacteroidota bacterium]
MTHTMTTRLKRLTALTALALLAFTGVGCDSDGDEDPPEETFTLYEAFSGPAGDGVRITDRGEGTGSRTLSADTTYYLSGFVFVNSGQTLTVEAGTVVRGLPGAGEDASALIVAQGGRIEASGTATNPIIFTSAGDDVTNPNDIPAGTSGLWGGVILLGNAPTNTTPAVVSIEGIPTTEARGSYGGSSAADNSGTLRYASIRYGGTDIGAGNEINGLTLGGVGSGTTVEFVEVFGNADDGVEFFGGTVNTKYLAVAFVGDDSFDTDQGYVGDNQFWFAVQSATTGNRAGEHDGGDADLGGEDATPFSTVRVSNATYIGSGAASGNDDNDRVLEVRDNAAVEFHNSIFTDFADGGIRIEDLADAAAQDSRARFDAGDFAFQNNYWFGFGAGGDLESLIDLTKIEDSDDDVDPAFRATLAGALVAGGNVLVDPQLAGISRSADGGLNPTLAAGSPALTGAEIPTGDFESVPYVGAFGATNWLKGWTALDALGYLAD